MLVTLPTVPDRAVIEYQKTILYTDLSAPQTTFVVLVTGIPSNFVVCGTNTRLLNKFTGSTLSSLTCSIGAFVPNTILSDLTYYGMPLELTQNPTSQTFQTSGPPNNDLSNHSSTFSPPIGLYFNGPHDVAAYFTAIGANLSSLTAGAVEVTVQIRPI
jgi:hypothetical protein